MKYQHLILVCKLFLEQFIRIFATAMHLVESLSVRPNPKLHIQCGTGYAHAYRIPGSPQKSRKLWAQLVSHLTGVTGDELYGQNECYFERIWIVDD